MKIFCAVIFGERKSVYFFKNKFKAEEQSNYSRECEFKKFKSDTLWRHPHFSEEEFLDLYLHKSNINRSSFLVMSYRDFQAFKKDINSEFEGDICKLTFSERSMIL